MHVTCVIEIKQFCETVSPFSAKHKDVFLLGASPFHIQKIHLTLEMCSFSCLALCKIG